MERAGTRLKRVREKLGLTYREVELLSQKIADRRGNSGFSIALSRLADIENKGTVPSIYRLYSLCAIYRLSFTEIMSWYGVQFDELISDSIRIKLENTHLIQFNSTQSAADLTDWKKEIDSSVSCLLGRSREIRKLPLGLLGGLDGRHHRFGLVGSEDWSMYPILHPGSLVVVD